MSRGKRLYYGWVVVAVSHVTIAVFYGIWYSFAVFFVAILEEFKGGRASTVLAYSMGNMVVAIAAPIVGAGIRRFGFRKIMPLGGALGAAGLLLSSTVTSVAQLYLSFGVIVALGLSANGFVPNTAILSNWFIRRRGTAIGIAYTGLGLGMFTFILLAQFLILAMGWRWAFRAEAAAILVLAVPLVIFFQKMTPQEMGLEPDGYSKSSTLSRCNTSMPLIGIGVKNKAQMPVWTLKGAIRSPGFWYVFSLTFFGSMAIQGVMMHQAAYAVDAGYDKILAAAVMGYLGLFRSVGQISWGFISDRTGREWAYSIAVAVMMAAILLLMTGATRGKTYLYIFAMLFGLGSGAVSPLYPAISADLFHGKNFAPIYGFHSMAFSAGGATGPWLSGLFFDIFGDYKLAFSIAFLFLSISLACVWAAAPRKYGQALERASADG